MLERILTKEEEVIIEDFIEHLWMDGCCPWDYQPMSDWNMEEIDEGWKEEWNFIKAYEYIHNNSCDCDASNDQPYTRSLVKFTFKDDTFAYCYRDMLCNFHQVFAKETVMISWADANGKIELAPALPN